MKQGTRRTRTAKLDTSLDAEIAAAEAKLKSLREAKKENARKFLESNQKAIMALLSEYELDRVPIAKWQSTVSQLRVWFVEIEPSMEPTEIQKPIIAEPGKFEEWSSQAEPEAA